MAIFTRQSLRLGPKVVPTEPVELDRDFLGGKIANYYLLGGDFRDYAGNSSVTYRQGTAVSPSSIGPISAFNGTSSAGIEIAGMEYGLKEQSQFCVFQTTEASAGSASNYATILFWQNSFAPLQYVSNQGVVRSVYFPAGGSFIGSNFNWDGIYNDGKPHVLVCSFSSSANLFYTMIDGVIVQSISVGTNTLVAPSGTMQLVNHGGIWTNGALSSFGNIPNSLNYAEAREICERPFAMLRPITRRQYYVAASAAVGNSTIISGGIGRIGGGFVAPQAQSTSFAAEAVIGAAIEASQSQTVTGDAALSRVVADLTAAQRNATALSGATAPVETAATATQSQGAAIGVAVSAPVSVWSGAQSQFASVAGAISPLSAAWTASQANITSLAISATISPISAGMTATQDQGTAIASSIAPVSSAWALAQANITTLAIEAVLGAMQSGVAASQAQSAAISAKAQGITADATATISQSASLEGRALPLIASWTVANANAVTLVVNAVLGRVTAAASLSQSQMAEIEAALAPLVAAWSSVGIEVSPHRIAVWPTERRIATWPTENRIARIDA